MLLLTHLRLCLFKVISGYVSRDEIPKQIALLPCYDFLAIPVDNAISYHLGRGQVYSAASISVCESIHGAQTGLEGKVQMAGMQNHSIT